MTEGSGLEILGMLERGEVHLAQNLLHALHLDETRFGSCPLEYVDLLAACHPALTLGSRDAIEVGRLAPHPLLLLDSGFGFRRAFDAACLSRGSSRSSCLKVACRRRCLPSLRPATVLRSFRRLCERIAMHCEPPP